MPKDLTLSQPDASYEVRSQELERIEERPLVKAMEYVSLHSHSTFSYGQKV